VEHRRRILENGRNVESGEREVSRRSQVRNGNHHLPVCPGPVDIPCAPKNPDFDSSRKDFEDNYAGQGGGINVEVRS
jgi:hypothetical protein